MNLTKASCGNLLILLFCFAYEVTDVRDYRLRAILLEYFDRKNSLLIQSCFEDILKKDPTCRYSLAKLIKFHQRGTFIFNSFK